MLNWLKYHECFTSSDRKLYWSFCLVKPWIDLIYNWWMFIKQSEQHCCESLCCWCDSASFIPATLLVVCIQRRFKWHRLYIENTCKFHVEAIIWKDIFWMWWDLSPGPESLLPWQQQKIHSKRSRASEQSFPRYGCAKQMSAVANGVTRTAAFSSQPSSSPFSASIYYQAFIQLACCSAAIPPSQPSHLFIILI